MESGVYDFVSEKNSICRICLESRNKLIYLFDPNAIKDDKATYDLLLLKCTSIKATRDDEYPQFICKICSEQLENFYLFRQKCHKSLEQFKKSLHNSVPTLDEELINRNDQPLKIYSNKNQAENDSLVDIYNTLHSNRSCDSLLNNINNLECSGQNCESASLDPINLQSRSINLDVTKLACNICGKVFTRHSSVKRHMTTHTGIKPHSCLFCNRCFTQSGTLSIHLQKHKEYKSLEKVKESTEQKVHLCSTCGKSFKQSSSLTIHLRRHSGEKPYSCKVCPMRFLSNSRLSSHLRIHSGLKPYSCKFCQKTFSQGTTLNKHLKTHLDLKPYPCTYCPKLFSSSYYRDIHIRKHTGEKPLSCTICQKSFSDPKNLKQHNAIHSGDKPFLCVTCGKKFRRIHHLKVHMSTHS